MKIYLDNNLGVTKVEQEELTQDTIGYNILKVYIPNAVLTPYDTFTCYYGALLQNGRKVGWFAMEARTNTDADYEANYTLYKATLEQCVVSVEGKVYIGCQVLLGNSGNATLIKKNTAVVQFNVRKSVAINNDILVLDTDQTTTDVLESYKNLLENALTTYATKATTYTKTEVNSALALKADKSTAITHTGNQLKDKDGNNIYPNLDAKTQAKIDNAYGPAYVGKDTSAYILAFTTNKGIYVATDTGHWYYWNGSQYVDGGVYQATEIPDNSITSFKMGDWFSKLTYKKSIFDELTILDKKLIDETGAIINNVTTICCDYYKLDDKCIAIIQQLSNVNNNYRYAFYDENKNLVLYNQVLATNTTINIPVPNNAVYFVTCWYRDENSKNLYSITFDFFNTINENANNINELFDYNEKNKNFYKCSLSNRSPYIDKKLIDETGAIINNRTTYIIDYIYIKDLSYIVQKTKNINHTYRYAFYTSTKELIKFVELIATNEETKIEVPNNAVYFVTCWYRDEDSGALNENEDELIGYSNKKLTYSNFSILGDSYSTFRGYTTPQDNLQWYPDHAEHITNDVVKVTQTWWYKFAKDNNCVMNINNSYSGSTICYDSYGSGIADGKTTSFVTRMTNVGKSNLLIIEGATNDSWAGVGMGDYIYSDWTEENLSYYRPALAKLLDYVKTNCIGTDIIFMLNNGLSNDINESTATICEHYNIPLLILTDIDKKDRHPSINGMKQINGQLLKFLYELYNGE